MKKILSLIIVLCFVISGCATPEKNTAFQTSTIDALLAGVYDGNMSCGNLLKHGDFGIGTFNHLDGEMVTFNGVVYQVKSNGKVYKPDSAQETPFATVCEFVPDKVIPLKSELNYEGLKKQLDKVAPNQNLFYAIKITGKFKTMKTRSVPEQHKPYPSLKEVTKHQPEFNMENISGTVVGFRCPPYVKGINVPGYHLHFISDDKTRGGHILKFELLAGECEIDILNQYFLTLPVDDKEFAETNLSINRSKELDEVEK